MAAPLLIGHRLVGAFACVHDDPGAQVRRRTTSGCSSCSRRRPPSPSRTPGCYTAAQHQKQYFEDLVLNNPVAIVTLDTVHNIVSCNPGLREAVRLRPVRGRSAATSTS